MPPQLHRSAAVGVLFLVLACVSTAHAHKDTQTSTAKVVVRHGHVSMELRVNLLATLQRPIGEHPGRSALALSVLPDEQLTVLLTAHTTQLSKTIEAESDSRELPLTRVRLPGADEVRAAARQVAMKQLAGGHHHPPLLLVKAESVAGFRPVPMSLRLPDEWGSVVVTFLEPQTSFVAAGEVARYNPGSPTTAAAEHTQDDANTRTTLTIVVGLTLLTISVLGASLLKTHTSR